MQQLVSDELVKEFQASGLTIDHVRQWADENLAWNIVLKPLCLTLLPTICRATHFAEPAQIDNCQGGAPRTFFVRECIDPFGPGQFGAFVAYCLARGLNDIEGAALVWKQHLCTCRVILIHHMRKEPSPRADPVYATAPAAEPLEVFREALELLADYHEALSTSSNGFAQATQQMLAISHRTFAKQLPCPDVIKQVVAARAAKGGGA